MGVGKAVSTVQGGHGLGLRHGKWRGAVGGKARLGVGLTPSKTDRPRLLALSWLTVGVLPTADPDSRKAEVWVLLAHRQILLLPHQHPWTGGQEGILLRAVKQLEAVGSLLPVLCCAFQTSSLVPARIP